MTRIDLTEVYQAISRMDYCVQRVESAAKNLELAHELNDTLEGSRQSAIYSAEYDLSYAKRELSTATRQTDRLKEKLQRAIDELSFTQSKLSSEDARSHTAAASQFYSNGASHSAREKNRLRDDLLVRLRNVLARARTAENRTVSYAPRTKSFMEEFSEHFIATGSSTSMETRSTGSSLFSPADGQVTPLSEYGSFQKPLINDLTPSLHNSFPVNKATAGHLFPSQPEKPSPVGIGAMQAGHLSQGLKSDPLSTTTPELHLSSSLFDLPPMGVETQTSISPVESAILPDLSVSYTPPSHISPADLVSSASGFEPPTLPNIPGQIPLPNTSQAGFDSGGISRLIQDMAIYDSAHRQSATSHSHGFSSEPMVGMRPGMYNFDDPPDLGIGANPGSRFKQDMAMFDASHRAASISHSSGMMADPMVGMSSGSGRLGNAMASYQTAHNASAISHAGHSMGGPPPPMPPPAAGGIGGPGMMAFDMAHQQAALSHCF